MTVQVGSEHGSHRNPRDASVSNRNDDLTAIDRLYIAAQNYFQVLNQTITSGGSPQDGAALSKLMWNRTFTILGKNIVINGNGDRDSDWALNQMDQHNGIFRVR